MLHEEVRVPVKRCLDIDPRLTGADANARLRTIEGSTIGVRQFSATVSCHEFFLGNLAIWANGAGLYAL